MDVVFDDWSYKELSDGTNYSFFCAFASFYAHLMPSRYISSSGLGTELRGCCLHLLGCEMMEDLSVNECSALVHFISTSWVMLWTVDGW